MTEWQVVGPLLAGLIGVLSLAVRAYIRLQQRQERRDDEMAARERKQLQVLEDVAEPLRALPGVLDSHRARLDAHSAQLRAIQDEQQQGFRTLALEIRDMGIGTRAATRELIEEIRAAWRGNHRTGQ